MAPKIAIEDLVEYVNAASALAECVSIDIINGGTVSDDTANAIEDLIEASKQIEYVLGNLTTEKRQLN